MHFGVVRIAVAAILIIGIRIFTGSMYLLGLPKLSDIQLIPLSGGKTKLMQFFSDKTATAQPWR